MPWRNVACPASPISGSAPGATWMRHIIRRQTMPAAAIWFVRARLSPTVPAFEGGGNCSRCGNSHLLLRRLVGLSHFRTGIQFGNRNMSQSAPTGSPRSVLTDRTVHAIRPPERGVIDVVDARTAGLALRVTAEGTKIWSIRYRPKGRPQRRATLGHYPLMSLAKARTEAAQYTAAAKLGRDLAKERDAEHLADQTQRRTLLDVLGRFWHCRVPIRPAAPPIGRGAWSPRPWASA